VAVSNRIDYCRPVYIGDTITTRVEVAGLEPARNRATMAVTWRNQAGDLVAVGEVVLKPPPAPER
jgi:acyl dehydratase